MTKKLLYEMLIEDGYFPDRDEAQRAAIAGEILVNDERVKSVSIRLDADAQIRVKEKSRFATRGGDKLQAAIDAFNIDVSGKKCIDIGSSFGGFSDCLLQNGARELVCVDVNYGDLAWKVRQDPRVKVFERTNIKKADAKKLGAPFEVIVIDVSFIGLASLAPVLANLAGAKTALAALVKPQFESKHDETENGVVLSEEVRRRVIDEVRIALTNVGFNVVDYIESPLRGHSGNIEYLIYAVYEGGACDG